MYPALGYGGGVARIIAASYPLVPPGVRQAIDALPIEPADLRCDPRANIDFVGYAIALNPFRDLEEVIDRLNGASLSEVLGDHRVWNPMHLNTVLACVKLVSRLCLTHGLDGTSRIEDSTITHRAWQMTALLRVDIDFGTNFVTAYYQAIRHLGLKAPSIFKRIHSNCLSCEIQRKKTTCLERRYELIGLKRSVKERRIILGFAVQLDENYYLPASRLIDDKVKVNARKFEDLEESAIGGAGSLGEVEMSRLLDALRPPYQTGSALVGMMAVAMLAPNQIHAAEVRFHSEYATIETETNGYTLLGGFDADLHRRSGLKFGRVAPLSLGEAFVRARESLSRKECFLEMSRWLRSVIPRSSLHRLASALLFQAPLWYDYPSSYAHLGLDSFRPSMPGWRYYDNFDFRLRCSRVAKYISRFDLEKSWEKVIPPAFSSGSNCTLHDEVVRGMVVLLGKLLEGDLPILIDEIILQWNAIAALAHLLIVGHLFVRNYPMLPPQIEGHGPSFAVQRDLDLINQKYPFVVWYAPEIQRLLIRIKTRWQLHEEALRRADIELDARGNETCAYGFWSLPSEIWGKRTSTYQTPRAMQCANGLLHWPEVEKYAGIHPNSMRHWSVTTLLDSGEFSLSEVNWIHGHGLASSQPVSPIRREPAFGPIKRKAFVYLAERSRLAEVV